MSKRGLKLYLSDILTAITNIEDYTKDMSFDLLANDKKTIDAVARNLEIIGEAARHIPRDVTSKYPSTPWSQMVGMRNKVMHEYFGVDVEILWQTITEDLPKLKEQILVLLEFEGA